MINILVNHLYPTIYIIILYNNIMGNILSNKITINENTINLNDLINTIYKSNKTCKITEFIKFSSTYNLINKEDIIKLIKFIKYNQKLDFYLKLLTFYTELLKNINCSNKPAIGICIGLFKHTKEWNYPMIFFIDQYKTIHLLDLLDFNIYPFTNTQNLFKILI